MAKDQKPNVVENPAAPAPAPAPAPEATIEQLMADMKSAINRNDFKAVSQISRQIDQRNRATEKAELVAKQAMAAEVADKVLTVFMDAVGPMIDSRELDAFDGIWISHDFGEQKPTCRLVKTVAKTTKAGGGGTGKKFDISTEDMLNRHGSEEYKDGVSFKEAYDSNTDKNWRYAIRTKLLKLEGIIG